MILPLYRRSFFPFMNAEEPDSLLLLPFWFMLSLPLCIPCFLSYTPVSRCSLDSGCTTSIYLHEFLVVIVLVIIVVVLVVAVVVIVVIAVLFFFILFYIL